MSCFVGSSTFFKGLSFFSWVCFGFLAVPRRRSSERAKEREGCEGASVRVGRERGGMHAQLLGMLKI